MKKKLMMSAEELASMMNELKQYLGYAQCAEGIEDRIETELYSITYWLDQL
jgi:uncharacterized protein (DUF302 family)